jgi:hypothetical protein
MYCKRNNFRFFQSVEKGMKNVPPKICTIYQTAEWLNQNQKHILQQYIIDKLYLVGRDCPFVLSFNKNVYISEASNTKLYNKSICFINFISN